MFHIRRLSKINLSRTSLTSSTLANRKKSQAVFFPLAELGRALSLEDASKRSGPISSPGSFYTSWK